jgi:hypothetical protein
LMIPGVSSARSKRMAAPSEEIELTTHGLPLEIRKLKSPSENVFGMLGSPVAKRRSLAAWSFLFSKEDSGHTI